MTRAFGALSAADQSRVAKALDALEREPRPRGKQVKHIQGTRDAFLRYRVGEYRLQPSAVFPAMQVGSGPGAVSTRRPRIGRPGTVRTRI